mgnify:CR=1 FL=1
MSVKPCTSPIHVLRGFHRDVHRGIGDRFVAEVCQQADTRHRSRRRLALPCAEGVRHFAPTRPCSSAQAIPSYRPIRGNAAEAKAPLGCVWSLPSEATAAIAAGGPGSHQGRSETHEDDSEPAPFIQSNERRISRRRLEHCDLAKTNPPAFAKYFRAVPEIQ